jgi:hypothetical protein
VHFLKNVIHHDYQHLMKKFVFFSSSSSENKVQHLAEINSLESMMKASQDTLRQMSLQHKQTVSNVMTKSLLIWR